tara:strand:+ start:40428 stop:40769 length:342 start_codon:yes stop_codon:yes gene_type:complete
MRVEGIFKRLSNGKWEGRRIIDVASLDPKWCKRSSCSNVVSAEYKETILLAMDIVKLIDYEPDFSLKDPESLNIPLIICVRCGENTSKYLAKKEENLCFFCHFSNIYFNTNSV